MLKCPECGGEKLYYDMERGERICASCGLVVEQEVSFEEPSYKVFGGGAFSVLPATGRLSRNDLMKVKDYEKRGLLSRVGRVEGESRSVMEYANAVAKYAERINAPKDVSKLAVNLARKIAKELFNAGLRLPKDDTARVALWEACKMSGIFMPMEQFEKLCNFKPGELYVRLSKVRKVVTLAPVVPKPSIYVSKLVLRLLGYVPEVQYISALEWYAAKICLAAEQQHLLNGKDPKCVAETAIHIADERMGSFLGRAYLQAFGIRYSGDVARVLASLPVKWSESPVVVQFILASLGREKNREMRLRFGMKGD